MQRSSVVFVVALLLSGCGGGGGAITPPDSTQPNSPAAGGGSLAFPAHYEVVDLGANVAPAAINAQSEVVGTIVSPGYSAGPGVPFRYQNGAMTKLPLPAGVGSASVNDVNDSGTIVGTDGNALKWASDGSVRSLGALPNSYTSVAVIDNAGDVFGLSPDNTGIAGCGGLLTQFFDNAPPQDVGPAALSLAINSAGVAVFGDYQQQGAGCDGTISPALYPGFASVAIPPNFTLNAEFTFVSDINASDAVVGYGPTTTTQGTGPLATFYSQGGHAIEIDPPAGDDTIEGNGLNDAGWIVGTMLLQTSRVPPHAFVWSNGKTTDLNALLPANCGWVLNTATDVNDSGSIIGSGTLNGAVHGFLLIPQQ